MAASQFVRQLLRFLVLAILARLLTPADFGLVGMVAVFTGFASVLADGGFSSALIQRRKITDQHIASVYWLNIATGALMTLLFVASAPLLSDFFGEPLLKPLASLIGANFIISSFSFVQLALLRREMKFRLIAVVETVEAVLAGGVAIVLALLGFGAWALAWQILVASFALAVGFSVVSRWRPRLLFDWSAAKELMGFSMNLLGSKSLNYWIRNADNLLIGKFVGSAGLGIYARAYTLMLLPISKVSLVIGRVMFPALSEIQGDVHRVRRVFLRVNRMIALVTFPMMLGMFAVAEPFVLAVLGRQWTAAVPVLQVLCLVGVNQSIGTTMGWIYESQGRTDWQFRWGLASGAFTLTAFAIGVRWGVMGVAWAYLIRTYLAWYPSVAIPGKLIRMPVSMYFHNLLPLWWRSIVMALAVWGAREMLLADLTPGVQLLILTPAGALFYSILLKVGRVQALEDVIQAIMDLRKRPREDETNTVRA